MKEHPIETDGLSTISPGDLTKFLDTHVGLVRKDMMARSVNDDRRRENEDRRYCRLDKNTDWPWPGASDINMPVEDAKIDERKAVLTRTFFGGPRIVDFALHRPDRRLFDQRDADSNFMEWALRYGIPDFQEHQIIGWDMMGQDGLGPMKTFWEFRRQTLRRVFRRRDFLSRYPELISRLTNLALQEETSSRPFQVFARSKALARKLSNQVLEAMKPLIIEDCGLDLDEKIDRQALEKIMRGLKSGQDFIEYKTVEVTMDMPRSVAIDRDDLIVAAESTFNHRLRTTHRLWFTEETLMQKGDDRSWSSKAVDQILNSSGKKYGGEGAAVLSTSRLGDIQRSQQDGILGFVDQGIFEIWECHWLMKTSSGVAPVWCVMHPGTGTLLKGITNEPYDNGRDPFDFYRNELNNARFHSPRGICEKLKDISWEITLRHRNKLNMMDMMVPSFTRKHGSFLETGDMTWYPGEVYDVLQHDALQPIAIPNYTPLDEREELTLLGWVERYIGGNDILSSQQSIHEARTKAEIDAITQSTRDVMASHVYMVNRTLNQIVQKVWSLFNQYGDATVYERITGQPFGRRSKVEMTRDYSPICVGRLETSDPSVRERQALQVLDVILKLQQTYGTLEFGQSRLDISEAIRSWITSVDPLLARRVLGEIPPEELAQRQAQAAAAQTIRTKLDENLPLSLEDAQELQRLVAKQSPHGKLQRMVS